MTRKISNLLFRSPARWLAAAGAAATLMVPLTASANHQNNDLLEVVATAAVAYVVVDAVGGFDNDKHRRHKRDRDYYRDQRGHDRHPARGQRHGYDWGYNRAHRARTENRRHQAYSYRWHQRQHRPDHRRHHNQHRKHQHKQKKHYRAYH